MILKRGFKPDFRKAELKTYKEDLSKRWVVEYWIYYEKNDKLIRKQIFISSKKYPTKAQRFAYADRTILEINIKLVQGYYLPDESNEIPISKAVIEYLDYKKKRIYSIRLHRHLLADVLIPYLKKEYKNELKISEIRKSDIVLFLDESQKRLDWANRTRNDKKTFLHTFFEYFLDRGKLYHNPVSSVKSLKQTKSIKYYPYSDSEITYVFKELEKMDYEVYLFCLFIYYCFIRPGEVRQLRVGDIDFQTGRIRLSNEIAKNDSTNFVQIPKSFQAILENSEFLNAEKRQYIFRNKKKPGNKMYGNSNIRIRFRNIMNELGYTANYSLYSFKHTGCCKLYRLTKDIKLVSRQCRHKSIGITDIYLRELGMFTEQTDLDCFT